METKKVIVNRGLMFTTFGRPVGVVPANGTICDIHDPETIIAYMNDGVTPWAAFHAVGRNSLPNLLDKGYLSLI